MTRPIGPRNQSFSGSVSSCSYELLATRLRSRAGPYRREPRLGALIGSATPIAIERSLVVLGVVAIGFIAHALFVDGPTGLTDEVAVEVVPQVLSPVESPE